MHLFRETDLNSVPFSKLVLLALGLLAIVWFPSQARAQVHATIFLAFTPGTLNSYQYVIENSGPDAVGEFDLAVPTTDTLTDVTAPDGWLALYTPGTASISWESTSSATDLSGNALSPPSFLGGFSFLSDAPAGIDDFQLLDYNTGDTESGMVLGPAASVSPPAAVPEASTTVSFGLLLALGLGGGIIAAWKKKAAVSA